MSDTLAVPSSAVYVTATPLPYAPDSLVAYGFSCAAVREHCAYEQACVKQLNTLVQQQRASLKIADGPQDALALLRLAPPQSALAELASEVVSHGYYWSSLRPMAARASREKYQRATLIKPIPTSPPPPAANTGEAPREGSPFAAAVTAQFGHLTSLRQQLLAEARTVHGSGWAWLLWDHEAHRLLLRLESGACCPLAVLRPPSVMAPADAITREATTRTTAVPPKAAPVPVAASTHASEKTLREAATAQAMKIGPSAARFLTRGVSSLSGVLPRRAARPAKKAADKKRVPSPASITAAPPSAVAPVAASTSTPSLPQSVSAAGVADNKTGVVSPARPRYTPLFACDLWEHAYWRDFGLRRDTYVACFWAALDWRIIEARFEAATQRGSVSKTTVSKL